MKYAARIMWLPWERRRGARVRARHRHSFIIRVGPIRADPPPRAAGGSKFSFDGRGRRASSASRHCASKAENDRAHARTTEPSRARKWNLDFEGIACTAQRVHPTTISPNRFYSPSLSVAAPRVEGRRCSPPGAESLLRDVSIPGMIASHWMFIRQPRTGTRKSATRCDRGPAPRFAIPIVRCAAGLDSPTGLSTRECLSQSVSHRSVHPAPTASRLRRCPTSRWAMLVGSADLSHQSQRGGDPAGTRSSQCSRWWARQPLVD